MLSDAILKFLRQEEAATAVEYAVMLGMILATILGTIGVLGDQTGGMWNNIEDQLDSTAW